MAYQMSHALLLPALFSSSDGLFGVMRQLTDRDGVGPLSGWGLKSGCWVLFDNTGVSRDMDSGVEIEGAEARHLGSAPDKLDLTSLLL